MKLFKTAACLVLTILIIISSSGRISVAKAQPAGYAYADLNSSVYFYREKNEDGALFIIPQTYCVEILAEEGTWYYVKYAEDNGIYRAVYGYCRKDDVVRVNEPLENPYLHMPMTIKFKAEAGSGYLPSLEIELTGAYYGDYTIGKTTLSYVYCGDSFGYIPDRIENYPLNDLPKDTSGDIEGNPPAEESNTMLIVAIVITLCAAGAVAVLYFTGRKKPL